MEKIKMKKIDEVIYHEELENGLNVYIYKKNGFVLKDEKKRYFEWNG